MSEVIVNSIIMKSFLFVFLFINLINMQKSIKILPIMKPKENVRIDFSYWQMLFNNHFKQ